MIEEAEGPVAEAGGVDRTPCAIDPIPKACRAHQIHAGAAPSSCAVMSTSGARVGDRHRLRGNARGLVDGHATDVVT